VLSKKIIRATKPIKTINKTDSNGNIIVSGYCNGGMEFENDSFAKGGAYLIKYDMNGNLLFALQDTNSYVHVMAIDQNRNIYLAGNTVMNAVSVFGKSFNKDYYLAKFDPYGNNIWVKYFYSPYNSGYDFGFCLDAQGNIYSTGTFNQFGNINITDSIQLVNTGNEDGFVAKYNSNLDLQWVKTITGGATEVCSRMGINGSGDVYVGGYIAGPSTYPNHYFDTITVSNPIGQNIFLAKYNNSGDCQWVRTAGSNGSDFVKGVYVDNNGDAFIAGYVGSMGSSAVFGSQTFNFPWGNIAMYVAQYDSNGNLKWVDLSQGGPGIVYDITGDGAGTLYVTGVFSGNWDFGTVSLTGNEEMFLMKIDYNTTNSSGNELVQGNSTLEVYPNPTSGAFTVRANEQNPSMQICIYDVLGKCVLPKTTIKNNQQVDLSAQPKGIYFVEMTFGEERKTGKIILE